MMDLPLQPAIKQVLLAKLLRPDTLTVDIHQHYEKSAFIDLNSIFVYRVLLRIACLSLS